MLLVEKLTWPCLKMVSRTCHLWETDPLGLGLSYAENSPATPATQTVLVLMTPELGWQSLQHQKEYAAGNAERHL